MISEELPEHQIFHILKQGEEEPIGPYSQVQIGQLLNAGQIEASDYVYYPELSGWETLSGVFELHQKLSGFGDDGQEPHIVEQSFALVESLAEPDEKIYYVAVQHIPLLKVTAAVKLTGPKSIVLTDRRIYVLTPKMIGNTELNQYHHKQIERVMKRVSPDEPEGAFIIELHTGDWIETNKIPKPQLERLEHITRELLEHKNQQEPVN